MRIASLAIFAMIAAGCDAPSPRPKDHWPIAKAELQPRDQIQLPGEAIYQRTCIACHAADGNGNNKTTAASFVAADGPLVQPDPVLLGSILNGKTGNIGTMPPHRALLSDDEAKAVLAFIRQRYGAKSAR